MIHLQLGQRGPRALAAGPLDQLVAAAGDGVAPVVTRVGQLNLMPTYLIVMIRGPQHRNLSGIANRRDH